MTLNVAGKPAFGDDGSARPEPRLEYTLGRYKAIRRVRTKLSCERLPEGVPNRAIERGLSGSALLLTCWYLSL
jgi:hypothetical protein